MIHQLLWELGVAIKESGADQDRLVREAGVSAEDVARVLREDQGLPVGVMERIARTLGFRIGLSPGTPPWLESDDAREEEAKRLLAIADGYAYEGAKRVESRHLIAASSILQAIYTTTDPLFHVDYWYRVKLDAGTDNPEAQVYFQVEGRRMSCAQDGLKFRKEPLSKKRPMTAREWVFEAERTRFVVLLCRPRDAEITQIAITLFPMEGGPGRAKPIEGSRVESVEGKT